MDNAPYHADIADGPETVTCRWARSADGVRIRVAAWPLIGAKGTVLLYTGRTEYIEKYGPTARELAARGFATVTCDWRGQGLSDRMLDDRRTGHVMRFPDYQNDVAQLVKLATDTGLPKPYFLIAHSMGGCIGLRSLMQGLSVKAAVFSAPMWGIGMAPPLRPFAWALSWTGRLFGRGDRFAPGTKGTPYAEAEPFESNQLTTDPEVFEWIKSQTERHPELALGGPSLHWLNEALRETRALNLRASPDIPCLTFLGSNERIIDTERVFERMSRWPGGRLELVESGEHEVMMERPEIRTRVLDETAGFFDRHI